MHAHVSTRRCTPQRPPTLLLTNVQPCNQTKPHQTRTSGRSTKLIHGGIRYLETAFWKLDIGSYKLVQEALEERAHMLAAAPYMNSPLPIMIPIYKWWEVRVEQS